MFCNRFQCYMFFPDKAGVFLFLFFRKQYQLAYFIAITYVTLFRQGRSEAWFCMAQCSASVEQTALFMQNSGVWDLADMQNTLAYWPTLHNKETGKRCRRIGCISIHTYINPLTLMELQQCKVKAKHLCVKRFFAKLFLCL